MGEDRSILEKVERLPVLIVAGTRFLAKELADGHGFDQGEWVYVDSVGKLKAMKAEQIAFGRGAEKLVEIKEMVSVSIARKHEVIFGSYPGVPVIPEPEVVKGGTVAELMGKVPPKEDPRVEAQQIANEDGKPSPKLGDKRYKANRGASAKILDSIVVEYVEKEDGYTFKVLADGFVGAAKDLREVSSLVKLRYAPKVTLKEVGE